MIEINLKPDPEPLDRSVRDLLLPGITLLLNECYERTLNEGDPIVWGRAWAALLFLREELLQPGQSPGGSIAKRILRGEAKDLSLVFESAIREHLHQE